MKNALLVEFSGSTGFASKFVEGGVILNIEWDNKFGTGNKTFDDQHKKLFSMANRYFGAVEKGENKKILEDIFEGLWWYTLTHFKAEEAAMEKVGYPGPGRSPG